MGVAADMQKLVSERGDKNLEFAREGYRLSLNPIESRFDELGFILLRDDGHGNLDPVGFGRAVRDDLVFDGDPDVSGGPDGARALIASLIQGEPISVLGGGGNEQAIPTGT